MGKNRQEKLKMSLVVGLKIIKFYAHYKIYFPILFLLPWELKLGLNSDYTGL